MQPSAHSPDLNLLDQDLQGIKRKLDVGEGESKRVRQKTGKFAIFYTEFRPIDSCAWAEPPDNQIVSTLFTNNLAL